MVRQIRRNGLLISIFACLMILCTATLIMGIANSENNASAADGITGGEDITIAHLTDTHYYPFRFGYFGNKTQSENDDFYYNFIMDKNTKLWLEAEAVFDQAVIAMKEEKPQYLIITGDVAQDGEFIAHIDMANKLRKLQNDIRESVGNENFQIFVVMGNHDLYNPESWRFDNINGIKEKDYYTSRMDISFIYAGLGYPNISNEDAENYYQYVANDLVDNEENGEHAFVNSYLSPDFNWAWEFIKDDTEGNLRSFSYSEDATKEEKEALSMSNFLASSYVKTIDNSSLFAASGQSYRYKNFSDGKDIDNGLLTFIAQRKDRKFTAIGMDVILSNACGGHILGAQLQGHTQQWMEKNASFAKKDEDTIIIGGAHHSILPHWEMQEEITTGFIVYNWQEVSDFLADYGMRYVYTGHQHANDTTSKVSFNGNQIIDMQSSATVSVGSGVKVTRIHHGKAGSAYAEKAYLKCIENNVVNIESTNVKLFSKVFANDKYGYIVRNKTGQFIDSGNKKINDYTSYSLRRVYENAVANKVNEFLKPGITGMLRDIVSDIEFNIGTLAVSLGMYADDLVALADNLIKGISTEVLKDYTYSGNNEIYKKDEYKIFGYLEELVNDICFDEINDGIGIYKLLIDSYFSHCVGTEVSDFEMLPEARRKALNAFYSGEAVDILFDKILDKEKGLYRLIEGLQNVTMDLGEGVSNDFKDMLKLIGSFVGFSSKTKELDISSFNLGEIAKIAGSSSMVKSLMAKANLDFDLEKMSITEIIDDMINKYLTDSFKKALGEYAYDIVVNFCVDTNGKDCTENKEMLLTVKDYNDSDGKAYTYIQKVRDENITVDNGKKPSMITNNFGADPKTTRNFTYFTDKRVNNTGIEYVETAVDGSYSKGSAVYQAGITEIYATTKPLIDIGIWCQSGYVEIGRHTIKLTGLKPNTTYAYRVGDKNKGYWSDWYIFTTAPEGNGTFEALIGSDLQSSTKYSYERLSMLYDSLDKVFEKNIAFMINPGDAVDNGRNLSQYKWWLNSAPQFYASVSSVMASGNHDIKSFVVGKASNAAYYGGLTNTKYFIDKKNGKLSENYGVSPDAICSEYNYLYTHFNYDLPSAQNQTTGFYYSFDYSGVHFTIINTNDLEENKLSKAQYDWLIDDLDKASEKIKIVIMHKSLYSAGSHSYDKDIIALRSQLSPLFKEKGVSLVIAGHDHTYTETYYLDGKGNKMLTDANGKNEISGKGTLYLTMGTMGEKFYNYVSNPEVPVNTGYSLHKDDNKLSDPTFGKLVYDGEKLYYYGYQYIRTVDSLGNVTDGYVQEIKKSLDWNTLTAIALLGGVVVILFISIIVTSVKNKKIKKVND